ncbi:WxL domain-containing protein [Lacticaseibacillus hegangensis]|uniref:WxL domain-containing protein n=1 Tax=Lacticaseibacillus hegangensis TaxID=2486010 RepID=A0ABW4CW77_9LACO|nr:WxL domain-containing protein [Lacticaseibacillus hegangensis]
MKKTLFVTAAVVAMTAAGALVGAQTVFAADAVGKSNAEFNVVAGNGGTDGGDTGDDKDLILNQIPDLRFTLNGSDPTVGNLMNGSILSYTDGAVKKQIDPVDKAENQIGAIKILDYRGTNAGWNLSATMASPSNGSSTLTGTLHINAPVTTFSNVNVPDNGKVLTADLTADGKESAMVWNANAGTPATGDTEATPGEGTGVNLATVDGKTTFKTDANANATKGQYDATITWTLAGTPAIK